MIHAVIAVGICVLPIYILPALFLASLFLSLHRAIMLLGLLLLMAIIPLNDNSKLGHKLSRYVSKHVCDYFPITLHADDHLKALDPTQPYVFGFEPHSVFPVGVFALLNRQNGFTPLPKVKFLASSAIFYTPILRHAWAWLGLTPATKPNFISVLAAGYSCIIVPGGIQETFHMEDPSSHSEIAFLKTRKGFIRVAMEMGCPLVPVFCFGQTHAYKWWKPDGNLYRSIARAIKFTPIVFWGLFGTPLPYKIPMHVVVGTPINLNKTPQPTMDEVNEVQNKFIAALQDLFQRHKARVGYPDLQLRII